MPSVMASSRKPLFPEKVDREGNNPAAGPANQPVISGYRPFVRKSEIWIMEFIARSGRLTDAMLYYR